MGSMSFRLPADLTAAERHAVGRAALAGGYDLAPVPTRHALAGDILTLTRDAQESGYLLVPWPDTLGGETVCLSTTLRERAEPYDLLVELARGKVNQARTQAAAWAALGFEPAPADRRALKDVSRRFGQAALDPAGGGAAARDAIARAGALCDTLAGAFATHLLDKRLADGGPLETRLGCRLTALPPADARASIAAAFTSVRLVPDWRAAEPTEAVPDWAQFDALVDWAVGAGLDVSVGPIIDLADGRFPDWVRQWAGDLPSLAAFFCDFAENVVRRYQDRVRAWQVVAGFNHVDRFGLGEDDRLRLSARLLDAVRQTDPDGSYILGLAQPWGDYLSNEDLTYSPLVFVDTLVRAGFSFAAVDLEVLTGPAGQGDRTATSRDGIALYRLAELFGMLSIPLEVTFGGPLTAATTSIQAQVAVALGLPQVRAVYWEGWTAADGDRVADAALGGPSPAAVALRRRLREWRLRYLA